MGALPSSVTKANLDDSGDDPKQARAEIVAGLDAINSLITYLNGLFSSDGAKATALATLGAMVKATPVLGGAMNTGGYAINFSEGAAVASATETDIWATDGNTVHITGTTTITDFADAPRIGASRWVIFDGVLTLTHGSGITLQGGSNVTTAAGDYAYVYADAVDAFTVLYFRASGEALVTAAAGLVPIEQKVGTTNVDSLDFETGIDSTYRTYLIDGWMKPATDDVELWLRTDSAGGASYDAGASDYAWGFSGMQSTTLTGRSDGDDSKIVVAGYGGSNEGIGNASTESVRFQVIITNPSSAAFYKLIHTEATYQQAASGFLNTSEGGGFRAAAAAIDAVQLLFESGQIDEYDVTLYGISDT